MNKKIVAMLTATVVALGIMTTNYTSIAYAAEATEAVEQAEGEAPVPDEMQSEEASEAEEETAKDEKEMDNIDRAKNGVVQINCVYKTSDNISHILRGASGILIGEADGTEYVLTSLALMTPDDETKNSFLTALGVGADDRERATLTYEVVIENDMTTEASLVNSSVDLDLAVFKLSQSLYNRTPMTFLYSADNNKSDYNSVSSAYALGFPDAIVFETNEVYYSNDRVNKTSGQICNIIAEGDTQWVEHTAQVGENNAGGPIITEDGYVIVPPLEPSPKILMLYPSFLFFLARFTTFASPTSARKTFAPSFSAISSIRMEVGQFTASAGLKESLFSAAGPLLFSQME